MVWFDSNPYPHQQAVRLFYPDEAVGIDFFLALIPVHELGIEFVSALALYMYISTQFPQFLGLVIISSISLDTGIYVEECVKLFHVEAFFESPERRVPFAVNQPFFRYDLVADQAGV